MMILRITLLTVLLACTAQAVLNKDFRRPFDAYGPPPRLAAQYGPPPPLKIQQHLPQREYGVPQKIPFREYGPPAIKYGPPKLNFINGGGGGGIGGIGLNNIGAGIHEQIKTHFGVPKPFYGPPHIQHKPVPVYGPPKQQYGPPPPAPRPQIQIQQHRPAPSYGPPLPPPKPIYGAPPALPQALPLIQNNPVFKPAHLPASSYGPPPSGPLQLAPKPNYGPPPAQNYGPPALPIQHLQGPQPGGPNRVPETTIILTAGGQQGHLQGGGGHIKQEQIQIDASGHTHSISGSQAPFVTACEGWKPIAAPVGLHVEHNQIEHQSGYSQVAQGGFGTQYSAGSSSVGAAGAGSVVGAAPAIITAPGVSISSSVGVTGGASLVDGLTDEQLVAIALQSGGFDGNNNGLQLPAQPLPPSGPAGDFKQHSLNSIESDDALLQLGGDSYSRPPSDSYAPGSVHDLKYNTINGVQGLPLPDSNYGPPPLPSAAAFVSTQQQQHHHHHHHGSSASQAGLAIQYGTVSGNQHPLPPQAISPPNKPVAYRPPVPQGLLESIGATVQHLDQFGVKPQNQPPTYIPPATNEFAQTGPGNVGPEYGAPPAPQALQAPQQVFEQELPQAQPPPTFYQEQGRGNEHQQQQQQQQYIPPPPLPAPGGADQLLAPPLPPPQLLQHQQQQQHFENSFSSSQYNEQFIQTQGLPAPQPDARFNQVYDCGHGPNLYASGGNQQFQQQTQYSANSAGAYNAIAQSIPVAESHTQFIAGPSNSYGPPASGNDIDHDGYASQQNSVATLPDGTDPQGLPGLDGLNVISAQKSQSIQINPNNGQQHTKHTYQLQLSGSPGGQHSAEQASNHEEILSEGLLQSILTAIEQPNTQKQQQQQQQQQQQHQQPQEQQIIEPRRNLAQSRSDIDLHEDATEDVEDEPALAASNQVSVKVSPDSDVEEVATVTKLKAIVPEEELESHNHHVEEDDDDGYDSQ